MPPKPAPPPPTEYIGRITPPKQEFTGAYLIPKEEWKLAAESDTYLLQIKDFIAQDVAYIAQVQHEISELMRTVRGLRARVYSGRKRMHARQRQYKHFEKILRRRMAIEKMKKMRKEMGVE